MEFLGTDTSSSMEFHGTRSAPISMTRVVPWNSMELQVHQFRWHEQFHGIPWNSLELGVRQFRWHEQFHGIPWNSMELEVRRFRWQEQFHGIPLNSTERGVRQFPWNSMELQVRQFRWHEQFHGIPWNLGCAKFSDTSSSMEFHGIPWNLDCANFADTISSMAFHGTWRAPILMTRAVPWNSMELRMHQFRWHEQFHGIPWKMKYANFADTNSSMEPVVRHFAETSRSMEFHGIAWKLECANFADASSSMEFQGTWGAPNSLKREMLRSCYLFSVLYVS